MARPIDFHGEIGRSLDGRQLVVMGNASLILGSFLGVLVVVPNPLSGHLLSAGISATVLLIGVILKRLGNVIDGHSVQRQEG